jgi:hypothetical protein
MTRPVSKVALAAAAKLLMPCQSHEHYPRQPLAKNGCQIIGEGLVVQVGCPIEQRIEEEPVVAEGAGGLVGVGVFDDGFTGPEPRSDR